ncbi:MAG TPA: diacylglycerol kinase family protein [Armatimonadota bacterium]|jgi:YegS/Rv2252/BmrU family lipid kinase
MRIHLILNPEAGGGSGANYIGIWRRTAAAEGHALEITVPSAPTEIVQAVQRACQQGAERILVAGGDGTVNHALPALAHSDIPLGIIPVGTANVLARVFGIPLAPEQAFRVACTGTVRNVDLGRANDRLYALTAGMGFDAEVITEIVPRLKDLFGPLAYITAGIQVLTRFKSSLFHLQFDGKELLLPAWLVIVANAGYYAYQLTVSPEARIDDGLLDVVIFAEQSALDRLTQIGATMLGQHTKHPNVQYFQVRNLHVVANPAVRLQLDGDEADSSPVDFSVLPGALRVMVPAF